MKLLRATFAVIGLVLLAALPARAQVLDFDYTTYYRYLEEFNRYAAADWTINRTEAGSGSGATALTNVDGAALLITNDNANDDNSRFQLPVEAVKFDPTKRLFFKTRFKVSDATQSDVAIGLQITDTTPLDVTHGIFFIKADDATTFDFRVEKADTASTLSSVATLASDTWITLAFYYEPSDARFQVFVNDVRVGSVGITNAPNDEELAVSFALQNGDGNIRTMTIDYLYVAESR